MYALVVIVVNMLSTNNGTEQHRIHRKQFGW